MKNTEELRVMLSDVYDKLSKGEIDIQNAKAIVATSNAILKSAQLEMDHSKMTGNKKPIKFLETN